MKKLTVNRLALGNLRARKKQYTLMITGIVLAMIFSSGIIFFISCLTTSLTELSYNGYGEQDVIMGLVTNRENLQGAVDEGILSEYGYAEILGYAYSGDNDSKGFSYARFDENAMRLSRQTVSEGRLPEKEGEIAIEADALARLRLKPALGDKLTFKVKVQSGKDYLEKRVEKTFTLVGILKDKRSHIQEYNVGSDFDTVPAAIVSSAELTEAGGTERTCAYATFRNKDRKGSYYSTFFDYNDAHECTDYHYCEWTDSPAYFNLGGGGTEMKGVLAGVLAGVLTVASCVGIVNAFNTNLQDRKKQIGLLRAVGTTRKQIIEIFGREAFIIALIAAPVSVIASYFLTKGVIRLMGEDMVFAPKLWILPAGAVLGICVVMLAALIPLSVAAKVSPMQAIRNTDIIRKMKNSRFRAKKEFRIPSLLAQRDMAFSKGKTAAVCIMLIISFLLGSLGISFLSFAFNDITFEDSDYRIYRAFYSEATEFANNAGPDGYGIPNASVSEIMMMPYVESVSCTNSVQVTLIPQKKYAMLNALKNSYTAYYLEGKNACPQLNPDNYRDFIKEQEDKKMRKMEGKGYVAFSSTNRKPETEAKAKFGIGDDFYNNNLLSAPEEILKSGNVKVIEGKIDIAKLNSGEEILIVLPKKAALTYRTMNEDYDGNHETLVDFHIITALDDNGKPIYDKRSPILEVIDNDVHAGDTVDISMVFDKYFGGEGIDFTGDIYSPEAKQYRKTVKIGAIIENIDIPRFYTYEGAVVTTNAGYATFGAPELIDRVSIMLNCECTEEIDNAMTELLTTLSSGNAFEVHSTFADKADAEREKRTIVVGFASIIILFFSVCTSLINNSMSSKIREDKRQIGTLRAVGASAEELIKAYVLRLLRIFAIGFTGGLIAYALAHTGIYLAAKYTGDPGEGGFMKFLVWPAICFCALMFAVCAFNLWRQIRKQMKYSIVDNIREL